MNEKEFTMDEEEVDIDEKESIKYLLKTILKLIDKCQTLDEAKESIKKLMEG